MPWSDQNHGIASYGAGTPARVAAATLAWSIACPYDSKRTREPSAAAGCGVTAQSPAATIAGSLVRAKASTTMPPAQASPSCSASSVRGSAPMPMITRSARAKPPSDRCAPVTVSPVVGWHRVGWPRVGWHRAFESRHGRAEQDAHAAAPVRRGVEVGDDRSDHAPDEPVRGLHHRHRLTHGGGGGGRLEPDEAAADDEYPLRRRQPLPQLERVPDVAQVADPGQVGPGHRQAPRPCPGGQREMAELEAAAALGDRHPRPAGRRGLHVRDPLPGQHGDPVALVVFG